MSDIYYKDTKGALDDSLEATDKLFGVLDAEVLRVFESLNDEVDQLLVAYSNALGKIDELEDRLLEAGIEG